MCKCNKLDVKENLFYTMAQTKRKFMMMHKALHLGDKIDRLYMFGKEERTGFTSIEYSVSTLIRKHVDYIKNEIKKKLSKYSGE